MSKMAQDYNAINLSQGFPDFDCPERLRELVGIHLNSKRNQYPPMAGIPELRQQIALKLRSLYNYDADPEHNVTVTSGATEALFDAIHAVVRQGDEVIVFDPVYDSYVPAIRLAGGIVRHIPLQAPQYSVDWARVSQSINSKTRMIIINTPHNPCGAIFSSEDLDSLAQIIRDTPIIVLSDEVYEHMVYDGLEHQSVLRHPELKEKCFAVFSFGKTYHATGWKLAYCAAAEGLTEEFRKIHQYVTFTTSSFVQYGIADYMKECPQHTEQLPQFYQTKRDYFCQLIESSRFTFTPSASTYFQLVDYGEISKLSDVEFCNYLTQKKGVAAIPLAPFYENAPDSTIIRFCFCKDNSTLEQAAKILCDL